MNNQKNIYIDSNHSNAYIQLGKGVLHFLNQSFTEESDLVILCIGTDRATGDCLGPLVGELLRKRLDYVKTSVPCHLYGTLKNPVHAVNLSDIITDIFSTYDNPYIIAIDASLGATSHIGYITVGQNALQPGKGVQKKLPAIGNLSITGIVNLSGLGGTALLQSTRLYTVMQLSELISKGLLYALRNYHPVSYYSELPL